MTITVAEYRIRVLNLQSGRFERLKPAMYVREGGRLNQRRAHYINSLRTPRSRSACGIWALHMGSTDSITTAPRWEQASEKDVVCERCLKIKPNWTEEGFRRHVEKYGHVETELAGNAS